MIGASKLAQLESNLAATELKLTANQIDRLSTVSAPPVGFSSGLTAMSLRSMLFGGHSVTGWND